MEGLVNYSSEDDQDEPAYKRTAERGNPIRNYDGNGKSNQGGNYARNFGKDETPESLKKSYSGGNRSSSSYQSDKDQHGQARESRDRRNSKEPRESWDQRAFKDRRNSPDSRDQREFKETRDSRDQRDFKDTRDSRDQREFKDTRDSRDQRDFKDIRDSRDSRDQRDFKDKRDSRGGKDQRDFKEPRDSRDQRDQRNDLKDRREPREKYDFKDLRDSRDSREPRDLRDQRDSRESHDSRHSRELKDARDSKEPNNGHQRHDSRPMHNRQIERQGRDYKSDEFNRRDRSRPDERNNNRYSGGNSSHNPNTRDNRHPRYSGGGNNNKFDPQRARNYRSPRGGGGGAGGGERDEGNERHPNSRPERHHRHESNRFPSHRHRRSHSGSKSRSRTRTRSRSPSPSPSLSKDRKYSPFHIRTERSETSGAREAHSSPVREKIIEKCQATIFASDETPSDYIEPIKSLPLSDKAPKHPNLVAVPPTIAAGLANPRSNEPAVIQVPNYYNPSVINPTKYAEQVQKRKLLWGAKKSEDTASKWGNAHFSQDTDGKVASKFMRLMGIKNASAAKAEDEEKTAPALPPDVKSREAMFSTMEHQYEVARQATHTMRGVGLGFGTSRPY